MTVTCIIHIGAISKHSSANAWLEDEDADLSWQSPHNCVEIKSRQEDVKHVLTAGGHLDVTASAAFAHVQSSGHSHQA